MMKPTLTTPALRDGRGDALLAGSASSICGSRVGARA